MDIVDTIVVVTYPVGVTVLGLLGGCVAVVALISGFVLLMRM